MKAFPGSTAVLALTALSIASAARSPANLEPFEAGQVCIGHAEVLVGGQPNPSMIKVAQDRLNSLGAAQKLGKAGQDYTTCPAWLSFHAEAGKESDGRFVVYFAELRLVTARLQTKALENLKSESFDYDGGFESVTLWDRVHAGVMTGQTDLAFAVGAEVTSHMADFADDWKKTH